MPTGQIAPPRELERLEKVGQWLAKKRGKHL